MEARHPTGMTTQHPPLLSRLLRLLRNIGAPLRKTSQSNNRIAFTSMVKVMLSMTLGTI